MNFFKENVFRHLLENCRVEVMWRKTIKHAFSMFYTLIKHRFLTNQSARKNVAILLTVSCALLRSRNMEMA